MLLIQDLVLEEMDYYCITYTLIIYKNIYISTATNVHYKQ
jgi:hypothetical protein